jgi:hypothetical protein
MPEKSESESSDKEPIVPDAIIIDDVQYEKRQDPFSGKIAYLETIQDMDKRGYPFFLRVITFIAGIALFCWTLCVALCLAVVSFLAVACLFKVDQFNQSIARFWKILRRMSAFTLSLFVATFAPAFGFGTIALYMMLQNEDMESSFIGRLLKTYLRERENKKY